MGNTMFMLLNTDEAQVDNIYRWNDTTPDSVNFTVGTADGVNTSGDTYIAYVFANITWIFKFWWHNGYRNN